MPYAIKTDLEKHSSADTLVQLTDRADPPAGVADEDVINQALESASSFIDGYLRGRYSVPLASAPAEIRDACVKLAFKELYTGGVYPEGVQKDYDATVSWLATVSKGVVQLSADAAPAPAENTDGVTYVGPDRTFNRDTLKVF